MAWASCFIYGGKGQVKFGFSLTQYSPREDKKWNNFDATQAKIKIAPRDIDFFFCACVWDYYFDSSDACTNLVAESLKVYWPIAGL